jgi:hypothetical protein
VKIRFCGVGRLGSLANSQIHSWLGQRPSRDQVETLRWNLPFWVGLDQQPSGSSKATARRDEHTTSGNSLMRCLLHLSDFYQIHADCCVRVTAFLQACCYHMFIAIAEIVGAGRRRLDTAYFSFRFGSTLCLLLPFCTY